MQFVQFVESKHNTSSFHGARIDGVNSLKAPPPKLTCFSRWTRPTTIGPNKKCEVVQFNAHNNWPTSHIYMLNEKGKELKLRYYNPVYCKVTVSEATIDLLPQNELKLNVT